MKKSPGIYRHGRGYRAVVTRGRGNPPLIEYFPPGTPDSEMQNWRKDTKATLRIERKQRASTGTFEGDARRYLNDVGVKALPSFKDRQREIAFWVAEFGTRRRDSITSADIRRVRERLRTELVERPSRRKLRVYKRPRYRNAETVATPRPPAPRSPNTINKLLRALSNLWTVLDGRRSPNPVRDVEELREPKPKPRALDYDLIDRIIAAMPDISRSEKGQPRQPISVTKIRARCLSYCQITPKQLKQITRADLDLKNGRILLPERAKGAGADAKWVRLLPQAIAAFRDFDAANLYGQQFSQSSLRKGWKAAARKVGRPDVTPYMLRHSFGTHIYRTTKSRAAVQDLMQHARWETSARYVGSAEEEVRDFYQDQILAAPLVRHSGTTEDK